MKFQNALDELQHYLGQLNIDVMLGVDRRHLGATSRLCWLLVDRLDPKLDVETYKRLQVQLLDLQRAIDNQTQETQPNPVAKRVGKVRVIEGRKREPKGVVKAEPRLRLVEP